MVEINGSKIFGKIPSDSAPNNSIFIDSSDNVFKYKDSNGNINAFTNKAMVDLVLKNVGCNVVRQLRNRTIEFGAIGGEFADAYTDSTGRLNTVNTGSTDATFSGDKYQADGTGDDLIYHDISAGTFSDTISSAFCTCLVDDWEDGANVQWRLKNSTGDDTGYMDYDETQVFTAFAAEPDELIIKLVQKSGSPTTNYPAINGPWVAEL